MNKSITLHILLILSLSNPTWGCNFSEDIKKNTDGTYKYTEDCHVEVGKRVKENDIRKEQVKKLEETITLKDLTITTQEKRAQLWMDTAIKLEDRVNMIDNQKDTNKWLWFGLGIVTMSVAVWGAGQLK